MHLSVVNNGRESVELKIPDEKLVPLQSGAAAAPLQDLTLAVSRALESPIDFPPVSQAVIPGDHVTIVLEHGVPQPELLLEPLLEHLVSAGVNAGDIQIVETSPEDEKLQGLSEEMVPLGIKYSRHDATDRQRLSYLATTKSGHRVYLNREAVDADVVILVGRIAYDPILGYRGTASGVFPGLADADSQRKFRQRISTTSAASRPLARQEIDEIGWLLGSMLVLQVVVGSRNEVVEVLAGESRTIQRIGQQHLDDSWFRRGARRADLVIAGISAAPELQGFNQLGAALSAASRLTEAEGCIVVLSSIDDTPGPALRSAANMEHPSRLEEFVRHRPSSDAISTCQIAQACQHAHVYLMTELDGELVEELFMTPIEHIREIQNLISQASSCHVLNDAQLTCTSVEGENGS